MVRNRSRGVFRYRLAGVRGARGGCAKEATMRVIIAGSRSIADMAVLERAIEKSGFEITEVLTGGARGVDSLAHDWAEEREIGVTIFPAHWTLGRCAGPLRNEEMAKNADALIAVWDGHSRGTKDMIARARKHWLKVHVELQKETV